MKEIALITDTHFGVRGDSKAFHSIFEDYYSNEFFPELKKRGTKTIICLGDFFERRKFINFETLSLARRIFFDVCLEMGIDVIMIAGNHDVFFKNTNRVSSPKLLLSDYPNVKVFLDPTEIEIAGVKCILLPWMNSENYEESLRLLDKTDSKFVFSHLEMKGFELHKGVLSDKGHVDFDLLHKFEFVMSGHYHHKSSRGNVHYLGTPYELTWSDFDDPKGFHFFDFKNLEFIPNPRRNFVRLIYRDVNPEAVEDAIENENFDYVTSRYVKIVIKTKNNPILFERFVDCVSEYAPIDLQVADESTVIYESQSLSEEFKGKPTIEIMRDFIETRLETELDKTKLTRKVETLYFEAQKHMETDE